MIVELPRNINPNELIKEQIVNMYGTCPCCGESRPITGIGNVTSTWYGKPNNSPKNWFQKNHHWKQDLYFCMTCGAKWETIPYPTDIINAKEANKIWEKIKAVNQKI